MWSNLKGESYVEQSKGVGGLGRGGWSLFLMRSVG